MTLNGVICVATLRMASNSWFRCAASLKIRGGIWSRPVLLALSPRSKSGYLLTICFQKRSCHCVSFFLPPRMSFALRRLSGVSGTNVRCICGVFSSMCTTAETIVSRLWDFSINRNASSKKARISGGFLSSKNSGLAVMRASTNRTLSFLVRHPALAICRLDASR